MVEVNKAEIGRPLAAIDVDEMFSNKEVDIPQAKTMELEDLEDLLQMVVSMSTAPEVYHIEREGEHSYLVWIVIHDYYKLNGLPLVIFVRTDLKPARFIKYRPSMGNLAFVSRVEESSSAYIKVIKIKRLPFCLDLPE